MGLLWVYLECPGGSERGHSFRVQVFRGSAKAPKH